MDKTEFYVEAEHPAASDNWMRLSGPHSTLEAADWMRGSFELARSTRIVKVETITTVVG